MRLAVLDIGSNAARFYIAQIIETSDSVKFKKIHYMRYPLRLGLDVFNNGEISKYKYKEFKEWVRIVTGLLRLYKVDHYMACATSAMRDASNGKAIVDRIFEKTGLRIDIIDGKKEAKLISNVLTIPENENIVHVDVGGGSTEVNVYIQGKKASSESFQVGSVRNAEKQDALDEFIRMNKWVAVKVLNKSIDYCIGTGGNIRKLQKLSFYGTNEPINIEDLEQTKEKLEEVSYEERIKKFLLNPDRADVIVPAAKIYISVMAWSGVDEIRVPDVGLKDGIMMELYQKVMFNN